MNFFKRFFRIGSRAAPPSGQRLAESKHMANLATDLKHPNGDGTVRVQIKSFGIYLRRTTRKATDPETATGYRNEIEETSLIEQTDRIPLRKGLSFGVTVVLTNQAGGHFVKLRRINRFPPPGLNNPHTGKTHLFEEFMEKWELGKAYAVTYSFDEDYEMLSGEWKFEFWDGDKKLAEKTFVAVETIVFPYGCLCQSKKQVRQPLFASFQIEKDGRCLRPGFSYLRHAKVKCGACGITWHVEETLSHLPEATENPPFTGDEFCWSERKEPDPYHGRYARLFYIQTCPLCRHKRSYYLFTHMDGEQEIVRLNKCMACGKTKQPRLKR